MSIGPCRISSPTEWGTYSMAMKWDPLYSPISDMPAMFGWLMDATIHLLAPKARDRVGRRQMRMQDFQRDVAPSCRVVGAVNRPLAARRRGWR